MPPPLDTIESAERGNNGRLVFNITEKSDYLMITNFLCGCIDHDIPTKPST